VQDRAGQPDLGLARHRKDRVARVEAVVWFRADGFPSGILTTNSSLSPHAMVPPTYWHQDEAYWGRNLCDRGITCWMPLQDVD
jgi:hypothetical protein